MLYFLPPPQYAVTVVGPAADVASFNEDGLIAGLRGRVAFVVQKGQAIWSGDGYTLIAGPNVKGQVALVGAGGLAKWSGGKVELCADVGSFGGLTKLGNVPDQLLGIADDGTILGVAHGLDNAFALIQSPAPPEPRPLLGFLPLAMSADGKLAGTADVGSPAANPSAFLDSTPLDPPAADGKPLPRLHPSAIARDGTVVGWRFEGSSHVAFQWKAGKLTLLHHPAEGDDDEPLAVNSKGQMLVISRQQYLVDADNWSTREAIELWSGESASVNLSGGTALPNGWVVTQAFAINDAGQILADASRPDQPDESLVMLTPK